MANIMINGFFLALVYIFHITNGEVKKTQCTGGTKLNGKYIMGPEKILCEGGCVWAMITITSSLTNLPIQKHEFENCRSVGDIDLHGFQESIVNLSKCNSVYNVTYNEADFYATVNLKCTSGSSSFPIQIHTIIFALFTILLIK